MSAAAQILPRPSSLVPDVERIRRDFPILTQPVRGGRPLVYLDNAATTQKPRQVIDRIVRYYTEENANVHRGVHYLSEAATDSYEKARTTVKHFINARDEKEIVFTRGTTEGINLVAQSWGRRNVGAGDEIVITAIEHHSNIVPWQMLCERTGAMLKVIPCHDDGTLDQDAFRTLLTDRTRVTAFNWISNAFGTVNPVVEMTAAAKAAGSLVLIDAAQAAPHLKIDVQALGADFLAFSGHKVYAPTGVGVLWGKREVLDSLPPWRGGGEMIKEVTFAKTTYNDLPFKYEAGTPNIEGAIALASALDFVNGIGLETIRAHEDHLIRRAAKGLAALHGVFLYGPEDRAGALSFGVEGVHHYDLGTLIDQMGVAVRTGHHCCQPLMARFGVTGTTRGSFEIYNTDEEVDTLVTAVDKALSMLR
jgi:cysteine desulfurase/selenocysteine lyase